MFKQFPTLALCLMLVSHLPTYAAADKQVEAGIVHATGIIKNPRDNRQYDSLTLPNGLQVILVSDPDTSVSAASLFVGVGSYQDPDEHLGMAHYLEHMLFLGTKKYPIPNSFQEYIARHSGSYNAYTYLDRTGYFFSIPSDHYLEALEHFSDFFKAPLFDKTYSDKERNAINAEWSTYRSDDSRILHQLIGLTGNPQHPLARFTVGNLETLQDTENSKLHEALVNFYQRYYSANIMNLALVGNQPLPELKKLAKAHFSAIPNHGIQQPSVELPGLLPDNLRKTIYYRSQQDIKQLVLDFPAVNNSKQYVTKPNEYISVLLLANEPGTLVHYLQERLLADSLVFMAQPSLYGDQGIYRIVINLTEDGLKKTDHIIAAMFSYLELMRTQGIAQYYHDELKAILDKYYQEQLKTDPLTHAQALSYNLTEVPLPDVLYAPYRLDSFDAEGIAAVLNQLAPDRVRIWHIHQNAPAKTPIAFYNGTYDIKNITPRQMNNWQKQARKISLKLPEKSTAPDSTKAAVIEQKLTHPQLVVDQAGAQAWLMHSQHFDDRQGALYLVINTDLGEKSAKHFVLTCLLNDLFALKNQSLITRQSRAGVQVQIERSNQNSQYILLTGDTAKHPELMQDLMTSFIELDYSQRQLNNVIKRFNSWIQNMSRENPTSHLMTHVRDVMLTPRWTYEEILAAAKTISLKDLKAYHQQVLSQNMINLFAFGHYDQATIQATLKATTDLLGPERKAGDLHVLKFTQPISGLVVNHQKDIAHSDNAILDMYIAPKPSLETLAHLQLINVMLQPTLYNQLRTQEQLGYIVGSLPEDFNGHAAISLVVQSENTDLPTLKARLDNFRQGFGQQLPMIDMALLNQAKQSLLVQLRQKPENIMAEGGVYFNDFIQGKHDFSTREKLIRAVEDATLEDLVSTYRAVVLNKDAINVLFQVRGHKFRKADFAPLENGRVISTIKEFETIKESFNSQL